MIHELKTWPTPFEAVATGRKTHELRAADRDFRAGDVLHLRKWDPFAWGADKPESNRLGNGQYTGRAVYVEVTYLTPAGEWGLPGRRDTSWHRSVNAVEPGLCCMSIRLLSQETIALVLGAEKAGRK